MNLDNLCMIDPKITEQISCGKFPKRNNKFDYNLLVTLSLKAAKKKRKEDKE